MAQDRFQLSSAAAEAYEMQKVPAMFGPLAEATLDARPVGPDDVVLDVACGTGILARTIRGKFGSGPRLVGTDLSEAMISVAEQLSDDEAIEWRVGDASRCPFPDDTFSAVYCQQGVQFFPDEDAVFADFARVLQPVGRLVFTVWSGAHALANGLAEALACHISEELAERSLAPFGWPGRATVDARLTDVGFGKVTFDELTVNRILANPEEAIPKEILGSPIGEPLQAAGTDKFDLVVADTLVALSKHRVGNTIVVPQSCHLVTATMPEHSTSRLS